MNCKQQIADPGDILTRIVRRPKEGRPPALYAACTASTLALRAVVQQAATDGSPALIESTPAQVNLAVRANIFDEAFFMLAKT